MIEFLNDKDKRVLIRPKAVSAIVERENDRTGIRLGHNHHEDIIVVKESYEVVKSILEHYKDKTWISTVQKG